MLARPALVNAGCGRKLRQEVAAGGGTKERSLREVLVFQHSDASPLGVVAPVLAEAGVAARVIDAESGCRIPDDAPAADGLIILGGAMCANDDARCPHFPGLLQLVRDFTEAAKPVLGICLGGQLIARALGGSVVERERGEFGFVPLAADAAATGDPLLRGLKLPVPVMQWHDDHFTPPPGAVPLLTSGTCAHQAFRAGAATYGFQGHFEVDAAILRRWADLRAELAGDPAIPDRLASAACRHLEEAMRFGRTLAARWLALGR